MLTLLLLVACGPAPPAPTVTGDVDAFVLASTATTLDDALDPCERIVDSDLRDGCRVEAIRMHGASDPMLCEQFSATIWRNECYFLSAEFAIAAAPTQPTPAALTPDDLCERAGNYREQCLGHVMNVRFKQLNLSCDHPVECMSRDRAVVEAAAARAAGTGATLDSVWADYYTQGMDSAATTRLDRCDDAATEADRAICRMAVTAYITRQISHWIDSPDRSPQQRQRVCTAGRLPDPVAPGLFDVRDPELLMASHTATRYACLPQRVKQRLALGWNSTTMGDEHINTIVAHRDPEACSTLRFPPIIRGCRDTIHAFEYQQAGAACAAIPARHPIHCVEAARPLVEAAQQLDPEVDPQREWDAWYFQHLWRALPLDRASCRAARTAADRATCETATADIVTRITTYTVATESSPTQQQALCAGGVKAVQARTPLVADSDPGLLSAITRGLDLGCAPDANTRYWFWEPGYIPD